MPDFVTSLQGKDLGHLEIIAELWGIELETQDVHKGIKHLQTVLFNQDFIWRMLEKSPQESRLALFDLSSNQGRMRWSEFKKKYGDIRDIGAGRRDREKPYSDNKTSPAEALWYRGLIGRTFFDSSSGLEEYIYIPDDIQEVLPSENKLESQRLGRPALKYEFKYILPARDWILEDACTLLAGLRCKLDHTQIAPSTRHTAEYPLFAVTTYLNALQSLLFSAGILDENNEPYPDRTRAFLESVKGDALLSLFNAWLNSESFNELSFIPGIKLEGEWNNDPKDTRRRVLEFIGALCSASGQEIGVLEPTWWSMPSVVSDVKAASPDYQRPAGDYDSWYIQDVESGEYLRGFESWDKVDGNLICFMLTGPLFWLGCVELGSTLDPDNARYNDISAFRFSGWANDFFNNRPPRGTSSEKGELSIGSDARISAPLGTNRALRYIVSRFCEWMGYSRGSYRYRITPSSLESARQGGLTVGHLLRALNQSGCDVPPNLVMALKGWEKGGPQAKIEERVLLKVSSPEILTKLSASRAARFFDGPLSPTVIAIKPGAWQKVAHALAELGYLAETTIEE